MSLILSEKPNDTFEIIPAGMYPAYCYGVVDLGEQYSEMYKSWNYQLVILWEIPGETIEINGEQVSRTMSKIYSNSLGKKSKLRPMLVSWRGRDFTQEEQEQFDIRRVVGAPCMLNVVHKTKTNGNVRAEIETVTPLPKGMPIAQKTMAPLFFDADEDDLTVIDTLPEWMQNMIRESRTYKVRAGLMPSPVKNIDDLKLPNDDTQDEDGDDVPF